MCKRVQIRRLKFYPHIRKTLRNRQLEESIRKNGVVSTIVIDERGYVRAGVLRVKACKKLGIKLIPAIVVHRDIPLFQNGHVVPTRAGIRRVFDEANKVQRSKRRVCKEST